VEQYGSASVAEKAFELVFLRPVALLHSTDTLRLSAFVLHVRSHSVEKTFRASIFEPPVVRQSVAPSEQRRLAKKAPALR
jgi:hypothetical protein